MSGAKPTVNRLLLIGPDEADPVRRISAQARGDGWDVVAAPDGFSALERVIADRQLEAVLLPFELFEPRSAALARTVRSAAGQLPVFMVCPACLEPEAARVSAAESGLEYLVEPLGPGDWQTIRKLAAAPASPARPAAADTPAAPAAGSMGLNQVLDRLHGPLEPLLASMAAWASGLLGGRTVRIRWSAQSARSPAGGPEPQPGRVYALTQPGSKPFGELAVDAAGLDDRAARDVAETLSRLLDQRQQTAAFRHMAFTDHLSGAYNRRYLMSFMDRLIARAQRERFRITLLMFDIDDLKKYNDEYGHAVGDEIIVDIARLMRQCSRPHDVVARIGGDEFAVLFWDSGPPRQPGSHHPQEAQAVADRFRRVLAGHQFRSLGPQAKGTLTISGGLASFPVHAADSTGLLTVADEALRAAKRSGKSRIYLVGREPTDIR